MVSRPVTLSLGAGLAAYILHHKTSPPTSIPIPLPPGRIPSVTEPPSNMHFHKPAPERHWRQAASDPHQKPSDSPQNLIPISSEFLRQHYAKFPDAVVNPELQSVRLEISALHAELTARIDRRDAPVHPHADPHLLIESIVHEQIPSSMDSAMYCARCATEEAAIRCEEIPSLRKFSPRFLAVAARFEEFQNRQKEHISDVIKEFLPTDFRGNVFSTFQLRSERGNSQAVSDLMEAGGTIRDKYNLLWQQQWKRRENLAMVGNASGVWKLLVRYLGGVPQPLLSFASGINAPNGPTEQLRLKFGASLTELVMFCIELNALCAAISYLDDPEAQRRVSVQLERGLELYEVEQGKFVTLLQELIVNSPFFIRPDQIASLKKPDEK